MLRSRISRRVIAEQHIHLAQRRPGFIGVIATNFSLREAVDHAAQRTQQARTPSNLCSPLLVSMLIKARN